MKENPQTADLYQVVVEYDMKNNRCKMKAENVPTVMLLGMLDMAKVLIMQSQVKAQLQIDATRAEARPGETTPEPEGAKA